MMRRLALLGALATTAAAPSPFPPANFFAIPLTQSDGPTTPGLPSRYTPAPVPNEFLEPPGPRQRARQGASLTPNLFHKQRVYEGDGFTPGSTADDETARRQKPRAGFNLSVPLQ